LNMYEASALAGQLSIQLVFDLVVACAVLYQGLHFYLLHVFLL
jgi:hypothetical protein